MKQRLARTIRGEKNSSGWASSDSSSSLSRGGSSLMSSSSCLFERSHQVPLRVVQSFSTSGWGKSASAVPLVKAASTWPTLVLCSTSLETITPTSLSGSLLTRVVRMMHQLAVRFLPMLDGALQQGPECLVLVFQRPAVRFQLLHPQLQLIPALLDVLHQSCRGHRLVLFIGRNHARILLDSEQSFNTGLNLRKTDGWQRPRAVSVTKSIWTAAASEARRRFPCEHRASAQPPAQLQAKAASRFACRRSP